MGILLRCSACFFRAWGESDHNRHLTQWYQHQCRSWRLASRSFAEKVLEEKADIGVALDGDGDRVILVDHKGEIVDGDEILAILASCYKQQGKHIPGVVGTLMSNFGLEDALNKMSVPFERAQVGDRYVLEQLVERDWQLGGETSGHIICRDKLPTGDA